MLFVYLNFHRFPSFDFRVHWNAVNAELGKTNSENPTSALRRLHMRTRTSLCDVINVIYMLWRCAASGGKDTPVQKRRALWDKIFIVFGKYFKSK